MYEVERTKVYDVAFAPINPRLIKMSEDFINVLSAYGISSCILKTSLHGDKLSGWDEIDTDNLALEEVDALSYSKSTNFIKTTYRTISSYNNLDRDWKPNFKILVCFMDDYAEGQILTSICKKLGVKTVYFQEGFQHRENQYSFSLYDFFSLLRSLFLFRYFPIRHIGMHSEYAFLWSEFGLKSRLLKKGKKEEDIFVLGFPLSFKKGDKLRHSDNLKILFIHQPLYPRYASKSWDNKLWFSSVNSLLSLNHEITLKFHPRIIADSDIEGFKLKLDHTNKTNLTIMDRKDIVENAYPFTHVVITTFSAASLMALLQGIPVIFLRTAYNQPKILEDMAKNDEIILIDYTELNGIVDSLENKEIWEKWANKGQRAFEKLGGLESVFTGRFQKAISEVLKR